MLFIPDSNNVGVNFVRFHSVMIKQVIPITYNTTTCSCEIPMGDLQSEEERDIVLQIKLPLVKSPQQDTVLRTTLSYFNVITSEFDMVQSELVLSRGGEEIDASYVFVHC